MKKLNTGIYGIFNLVNRKIYVGSTVDSFRSRWGKHRTALRGDYHANKHLQRSWNKHGEKNFEFRILERCKSYVWLCVDLEDDWTDKFRSELGYHMVYNIRKKAHSNKGFKHSEETRAKMSKAHLGRVSRVGYKHTSETCSKISKAHLGRKLTVNHRAKISKALLGHMGCVHTSEARSKISKALLDHKCTPETRAKMSKAGLGRKFTQEHKDKISKSNKGKKRTAEFRSRMSKMYIGRKHTAETRAKMSKSHKLRLELK